MAKNKVVRKKVVRKKKQADAEYTRPAFGFWYPIDKSFEVVIKDVKIDHIIVDECDEGDWYE